MCYGVLRERGKSPHDYYEVPTGSIKWKKTTAEKYAILWKKKGKRKRATHVLVYSVKEKRQDEPNKCHHV